MKKISTPGNSSRVWEMMEILPGGDWRRGGQETSNPEGEKGIFGNPQRDPEPFLFT